MENVQVLSKGVLLGFGFLCKLFGTKKKINKMKIEKKPKYSSFFGDILNAEEILRFTGA